MAQYAAILQIRCSRIKNELPKIIGLRQEFRVDFYEPDIVDSKGNPIPRCTPYLIFESKNTTFDSSTVAAINAGGGIIFNNNQEIIDWLKLNISDNVSI